jgi:hypothetical protein
LQSEETNPIIEIYKGRSVRKYNTIRIRVSVYEFKKFIDYKDNFDLSCRDAIEQKNILCKPCTQNIPPNEKAY